jgi:aminoglycoside phosphotransferase (APT) family kinase protein
MSPTPDRQWQGIKIDLAALNQYGRSAIPGFADFSAIRPIGGGYSNPTYLAQRADGQALVLRAMPLRRSSKSAHRIDREYRVLAALHGSTIPVPAPIHYCAASEPLGTPFYLMDYVPGPVFTGGGLPAGAAARRSIFLDLAATLGRLHRLDYRAHGLAKYGQRSGAGHFERHVASMTRLYGESDLGHDPDMETLIAVLQRHAPPEEQSCLVHGDFRLGNMVISHDLTAIAAVLDWELSTLGDPMTDLGYCTLMYHWNSSVFGTVIGADHVPDEGEFLDSYCRASGRSVLPDLRLFQAFSLFRIACITQAAMHRAATGHALPGPLPPENSPNNVARTALSLLERSP